MNIKSFCLISLLTIYSFCLNAQFVTVWETSTGNDSITIPTNPEEEYSYTVDWGDGNIISGYKGNATHVYEKAGEYTVSITGQFPQIYFNCHPGIFFKIKEESKALIANAAKLISVQHWGRNQWKSMRSAFAGCSKLTINSTDIPDLSQVSDMTFMFYRAKRFNQPIGHWDISNVTSVEGMFYSAESFNQPIGGWDVSKVIKMSYMFQEATHFNQDISNWDVSKVIGMTEMFHKAKSFNQPVGNWDISRVIGMRLMFARAESFNQPVGNWDVSNVYDMNQMFEGAIAFNQDISNWKIKASFKGGMFDDTDYWNKRLAAEEDNNSSKTEEATVTSGNINKAIGAKTSASSTYPRYSSKRVNDGDNNTKVGDKWSWANANNSLLPQWVQLDFRKPQTFSKVVLYTSENFPIQDYKIQYQQETGGKWITLVDITGNTKIKREHTFPTVSGYTLRILGSKGPNAQKIYIRVNEIEVY